MDGPEVVRGTESSLGGERDSIATAVDGFVIGTYVHGLFDDDGFRHSFIRAARKTCGLSHPRQLLPVSAAREARLDRLASHVRRSLDISQIKSWIKLGISPTSAGCAGGTNHSTSLGAKNR